MNALQSSQSLYKTFCVTNYEITIILLIKCPVRIEIMCFEFSKCDFYSKNVFKNLQFFAKNLPKLLVTNIHFHWITNWFIIYLIQELLFFVYFLFLLLQFRYKHKYSETYYVFLFLVFLNFNISNFFLH